MIFIVEPSLGEAEAQAIARPARWQTATRYVELPDTLYIGGAVERRGRYMICVPHAYAFAGAFALRAHTDRGPQLHGLVKIDVRNLVFPLIAGRDSEAGFRRTAFLGTGFFVSTRGLALTAAHVFPAPYDVDDVRAALPISGGPSPMRAVEIYWAVALPNSDIAVLRVKAASSQCFVTRFNRILNCEDVETTGLPESMFETDPAGSTRIDMRCARGYVSHGRDRWIAASFPLPKGMSGAPLIQKQADNDFVVGVFVGQTRGEQIEDLVEEITESAPGTTRVHVERVARVEYFARGELLWPFADFTAGEFDGLTLAQLLATETHPTMP